MTLDIRATNYSDRTPIELRSHITLPEACLDSDSGPEYTVTLLVLCKKCGILHELNIGVN